MYCGVPDPIRLGAVTLKAELASDAEIPKSVSFRFPS